MNRSHLLFFLFILTSCPCVSFSQEQLVVALGENKPPYTQLNPPGGIEFELITQIVRGMGMVPRIEFIPNTRAKEMLKYGEIDGVVDQSGNFLSDPYISYENVAISLSDSQVQLKSVADLKAYSVTAFQNAKLYLGHQFAEMSQSNPLYHEISPQIILNRMLFGGRVQVIVCDLNIFYNLNTQLESAFDLKQPLNVHRLFSPTLYSLNFRNSFHRDAFNLSLKKVLSTNLYSELARKYMPESKVLTFRP